MTETTRNVRKPRWGLGQRQRTASGQFPAPAYDSSSRLGGLLSRGSLVRSQHGSSVKSRTGRVAPLLKGQVCTAGVYRTVVNRRSVWRDDLAVGPQLLGVRGGPPKRRAGPLLDADGVAIEHASGPVAADGHRLVRRDSGVDETRDGRVARVVEDVPTMLAAHREA